MLQMCLRYWDELMHINAQCAGEDSFDSPLDCKEIKTVNPKGNQP